MAIEVEIMNGEIPESAAEIARLTRKIPGIPTAKPMATSTSPSRTTSFKTST